MTEAKRIDYDELFPGRFLKAGEFKGREITLTIAAVRQEKLPQDDGTEKLKTILAFKETEREYVCPKTNGECIKAMFGKNASPGWLGKRVTFFPEGGQKFRFDPTITEAIRVLGSPDIPQTMTFQLRLAKKKPRSITLTKTGAK